MTTKLNRLALVLIVAIMAILPLATLAKGSKPQQNVYIGPQETINDNVYKAGNIVTIEGNINGDLFVAGNAITIKGVIAGNVFAVGSSLEISGTVSGNVFAGGSSVNITGEVGGTVYTAGSSVNVNGKIAQNVFMAGSNVIFGDQATTGWNLTASGASVAVNGVVGRNADLFGNGLTVNNKIKGNLNATLDEDGSLVLLPATNLSGNLTYKSKTVDQIKIETGATVAGQTTYNILTRPQKDSNKGKMGPLFFFIKIISLFGLIIVGLILVALLPKPLRQVVLQMKQKPWGSLGWGAVYFIITPIVAIILLFTVIGIPLAVIVLLVYVIALYVVKVLASLALGVLIFEYARKGKETNMNWSLIVGVIAFIILTNIPLVGWILDLLLVFWALGAAVSVKKELLKKINE